MTPSWEQLATEMSLPTDVFIYRFHNNDPVNRNEVMQYINDLTEWLKLFDYDLRKMQGSKYTKDMIYLPSVNIKSRNWHPILE
jgi:teneurin